MNKEEILEVMRATLLAIDEVEYNDIIKKKNIPNHLARFGIQLANYLQRKKLNPLVQEGKLT